MNMIIESCICIIVCAVTIQSGAAEVSAQSIGADTSPAGRTFVESARNDLAKEFPEIVDLKSLEPVRAAAIENAFADMAARFPPCGHDTTLQRQAALLRMKLDVKTTLDRPLYTERYPEDMHVQIDRLLEEVRAVVEKRYESLDTFVGFRNCVLVPTLNDLRVRLYASSDSPFNAAMAQPISEERFLELLSTLQEAAEALPQVDGWEESPPISFDPADKAGMKARLQRYSMSRIAGMHATGDILDWQGTIEAAFLKASPHPVTTYEMDETLIKDAMPIWQAAEKECTELTDQANAAAMEHAQVVNDAVLFSIGVEK